MYSASESNEWKLLLLMLSERFASNQSVVDRRRSKPSMVALKIKFQIDSIVTKIDQMDKHKARQDSARDKLFGEIGEPGPRSRKK